MTFSTSAQIGDCLWACQFLHRIGGEHQFFVKDAYVEQLQPLMQGTHHVIRPLAEWDKSGEDVWIANARHESRGVVYQAQVDIIQFVMDFFNAMAADQKWEMPFRSRADMLWDSPAIGPAKVRKKIIDCLIINSDPCSGQCPAYSRSELAEKVAVPLIQRFGSGVIFTNSHEDNAPTGYTLAEIAHLSTMAQRIIAVANGPHWATWNIWSRDAERIIILDPQRLNFGPMSAPVHHASNASEVRRICEERGWL